MKNIIAYLFPVFVMGLLFTSCQKDTVVVDDDTPVIENFFSCEMDGQDFAATGFYAYATTFSDNSYNIYGVAEVGETVIYISLPMDYAEGTHEFAPNEVYSIISLDNGTSWTTNLGETNGTVTITERTATRVKGTFSFTIASFDDLSILMEVKEGKFDVEMR
jgi:hypothetical protein